MTSDVEAWRASSVSPANRTASTHSEHMTSMPDVLKVLIWETLKSGTIASLAIMPLGLVFRYLGFRIGHYGPKFAGLFIDTPQPWHLFVQHLIIGWLSTMPLLLLLLWIPRSYRRTALFGALYGAGYYVVVNSLALPIYFNDPLPWQLGWGTVVPSLIAHIAFGICIAWTSRSFVQNSGA